MYTYELQRVLYVNNRKLNVINRNYFLSSELVCRRKKNQSGVPSPNIWSCKQDMQKLWYDTKVGGHFEFINLYIWLFFFLKIHTIKIIKFNTFSFLPLIQDGSLTSRYPHFCTPSIQYPSSGLVNDLFDNNSPWGHFYYLHCINMHQ